MRYLLPQIIIQFAVTHVTDGYIMVIIFAKKLADHCKKPSKRRRYYESCVNNEIPFSDIDNSEFEAFASSLFSLKRGAWTNIFWKINAFLENKKLAVSSYSWSIDVTLLGLRQFLATESTLHMMKNVFYFTLKALFILKMFKILSWLFGHV